MNIKAKKANAAELLEGRRVIIVCASPLPGLGGINVFTAALAREARARSFAPVIVSTTSQSNFEGTFEGVRTLRLSAWPLLDGRLPIPRSLRQVIMVLCDLLATPDRALVVIQARFYPTSLLFAAAARVFGHACVIIDHGAAPITFHNPFLDLVSVTYERAITACERLFHPEFFGVSQASVRWLERLGVPRAGIVSNGIDEALFTTPVKDTTKGDSFDVVFCGRLLPQKGVVELIAGFRLFLAQSGARARLILLGDGPLRRECNELAASEPRIEVRGARPHSEAIIAMSHADVVASPSLWPEGFCTVALEAGALGRMLVATEFGGGGSDLLLNDVSGLVLEDCSAETIAGKLLLAYGDPLKRASMGAALRQRVSERFTWSAIFSAFLNDPRLR